MRGLEEAAVIPSLPLMGIGNAAPSSAPTSGRAHYPSWGLETTPRRRRSRDKAAHYPSWGLETDVGERAHPAQIRLITPHGDWKRPGQHPGRAGLVPHYPSWGLETGPAATPVPRRLFSLPLMGIGNAPAPSGPQKVVRSLPLMGIGNRRGPRGRGCGDALITPHGDWKRCGRGDGRVGVHALITPHGDWKPSSDRRIPFWTVDSLPLMGIGNTFTWPWAATNASSLPLMGIGNKPACRHTARCKPLITPHGDWKRWDPATRRPSAPTHYPSWGLETARPDLDRQDHRPLITPHGDWKRPILTAIGPERHLITPHGDWKPS